MTVAPFLLRPPSATEVSSGSRRPDLLERLRSPATPRPAIDEGLAGGLRAWLEDGVAGLGAGHGHDSCRAVPRHLRDGVAVTGTEGGRSKRMGRPELRAYLTSTLFRLVVTGDPVRHPFEDALCAASVADRGPQVLEAVRRLPRSEQVALRTFARVRATTFKAQWRPAPTAWLPRTGERLRVPLAGGAVTLGATADLVLGRPSDGRASTCLVRLQERRRGRGGLDTGTRTRRALALAETLRSGAAPWRVATYDPSDGRLDVDTVDAVMLVAAVRDALDALGRP